MIPRSIILPTLLLILLVVMVGLGYDSYRTGLTSPLLYFGGACVTLCCIVGLYLHLHSREK